MNLKSNDYNQIFDLNSPNLMYTLWGINLILFFVIYKLSEKCLKYFPEFENVRKQPDVKVNFLLR